MADHEYQLVCCDCGESYRLLKSEAEWYLDEGLDLPRRCRPCRKVKRLRWRLRTQEKEGVTGARS